MRLFYVARVDQMLDLEGPGAPQQWSPETSRRHDTGVERQIGSGADLGTSGRIDEER